MTHIRPKLTLVIIAARILLCALTITGGVLTMPFISRAEDGGAEPSDSRKSSSKVATQAASDDKADPKTSPKKPKDDTPASNPAAAAEARQVLKSAREKLVSFRSIKSKLVQTVAIGDRRLRAEGSYVQGSNLRLRLEFKVKSGELTGSLLEVCDGQVLWSRYTIGEVQKITRRDVRQILEAAKSATNNPEVLLIAELGLGGLPALLASIEQNMAFNSVREETIDGQTFTVLEGGWGKEFWNQWKITNPKSPNTLPEHIPDTVRIYLDHKTHLPRRFLYLKKAEEKTPARPMVTLDFVDLVLNAPFHEEDFEFAPPDGVPPDDITRSYLDRLRSASGLPTDKAKPNTGNEK